MPDDTNRPAPPSRGQVQEGPGAYRPRSPSGHDAADADLTARKKDLVTALDQLVAPLDEILKLMRNMTRSGIVLLVLLTVIVGVQVHTTLRMVAVEAQLADIVAREKSLGAAADEIQQTAQNAAAKADQIAAGQTQVTIEAAPVDAGGVGAVLVVKAPALSASARGTATVTLPLPPAAAASAPHKPGGIGYNVSW